MSNLVRQIAYRGAEPVTLSLTQRERATLMTFLKRVPMRGTDEARAALEIETKLIDAKPTDEKHTDSTLGE